MIDCISYTIFLVFFLLFSLFYVLGLQEFLLEKKLLQPPLVEKGRLELIRAENIPIEEKSTNKVKCNYCNKEMNDDITRAKEHFMGKKEKISACPSCPKYVREELWEHL